MQEQEEYCQGGGETCIGCVPYVIDEIFIIYCARCGMLNVPLSQTITREMYDNFRAITLEDCIKDVYLFFK